MLIGMAVFDTVENDRTWMTRDTLESLRKTVNWEKHRLIISDNGSCEATSDLYNRYGSILPFTVLRNGSNIGTARAINRAWKQREPGEHCVKMDNDVVIHQPEWVDWLEEVFAVDPKIGICGLKRKDLEESPLSSDPWWRSKLRMLPHEKGQRWIVVEEVMHVMGTCQAYSSLLLDRIGYLAQPGTYGFDDSLAAVRAKVAGFKSAFLHGFEIDHIDPGGTEFLQWKMDHAREYMGAFNDLKARIQAGTLDVYFGGKGKYGK
jgi:GT2 family glycosyltransferase